MSLTRAELEEIGKLENRLAVRQALRKSESYLVENVLPNGAIHIITGPPDIGKTTWFFQFMWDFTHGRQVFGGLKTFPCKWVYISIDRGLRDTDRTMRRLGYGDWDAPVYAMEDILPKSTLGVIDVEPTIEQIIDHFPDVDAFFIEGLQSLMPNTGRGQSQNKAEQLWCLRTRYTCLNLGKTIIAVTHTPKSGEYNNDREAMLGSQALIGGAGTVIKFQLPPDLNGVTKGMKGVNQTNERLVTLLPKNAPAMYLRYGRGPNGSFELDSYTHTPPDTTTQETEILTTPTDQLRVMDSHLLAYEGQAELSLKQMKVWGREQGLSEGRLMKWIEGNEKAGRILREGAGRYRRSATIGQETTGVN